MTQTRTASMIESFANVGLGFCISFLASLVILPAFGIDVTLGTNFGVTMCFTAVSLVRQFFIRRWFNGR